MSNKRKSLGSWFPSASVIKSIAYKDTDKITICLFYQYIRPLWTEERKAQAIKFIEDNAEKLNIGGRVRVGTEGLNSTISSTHANVVAFTKKLAEFDDHFNSTDFKFITDLPLDRAFKDLKVLPVKELVFYGIHAQEEFASGGVHLDPKDYHKKLGEENTVVIDVRNAYESDIGRFGGQANEGGAELLVPDMRKSTDFPDWIEREETKEKLQGKNVLMYCTGGVRCERASALLKSKYGDNVGEVYQLQVTHPYDITLIDGGIEKYLQEFPDGGYWQGKNFVFDKREAIGVGCTEGVGGIVQAGDKKKKAKTEAAADGAKEEKPAVKAEILGHCCVCELPWDRYIGKKKCTMCGVPVLLCISCSSLKGLLDKQEKTAAAAGAAQTDEAASATESTSVASDTKETGAAAGLTKVGKRQRLKAQEAERKRQKEEQINQKLRCMRCPLCVAQNITVPAHEISFTANGTKAVYSSYDDEGGCFEGAAVSAAPLNTASKPNKKIKFGETGAVEVAPKAAPTVCKWGGGYSSREEKGKSAKKKKIVVPEGAAEAAPGLFPEGTKIMRPCKFGSECTRAGCWFQH